MNPSAPATRPLGWCFVLRWLRSWSVCKNLMRTGSALAVALGLASCTTETTTTTTTTTKAPPESITVRFTPVDPYSLLDISQHSVKVAGFTLATAESPATVSISHAQALGIYEQDFPSNIAPKVGPVFLVRFMALTKFLNPPLDRYVLCWALVVHALIPGFVNVRSIQTGSSWTVVLVNTMSGHFQDGFSGHTTMQP